MVISSPLIRPVGLASKESKLRSTGFTGKFTEIDRSLLPSKACLRYWLHAEEEGKRVVTSDFVKKMKKFVVRFRNLPVRREESGQSAKF